MHDKSTKEKALEMLSLSGSIEKSAKLAGVSTRTIRRWAADRPAPDRRTCGRKFKPYGEIVRARALAMSSNGASCREIAESLGIGSPDVVRYWLRGGGTKEARMGDRTRKPKGEEPAYSGFEGDRDEQIRQLQLENDILRAVVDLLKADRLSTMSNRDKALLINELRRKTGRPLRELTDSLKISKSSYEYQCAALRKQDKYSQLRASIRTMFEEGGERWGYRTIWAKLRLSGTRVSEKVVRRIMREEGCKVVYAKPRKRYNSYGGEISEAPDNLVRRRFRAQAPNEIWLTDITEFKLPNDEKVYLSPIIDCHDGLVVSWRIGRRPNAELANRSLEDACATLAPGQHPICHSDRGCHYRWPGWIGICERNGLIRSMSKKGCSPDNSACEGFFGRLKNEFFYHRDWRGVTTDEFIAMLDAYLRYYNERRIKKSLGWMSPLDHRRRNGLAA